MIEELYTARNLFSAALERYHAAWSTIANCYDPGNPLNDISQELIAIMPDELERLAACKVKLNQVRAIVGQTRNIVPALVPINVLPSDILAHIFSIITCVHSCYYEDAECAQVSPLRYPEILSHVCSRWRHVAMTSHTLWTHIDLSASESCYAPGGRLLSRARIFATRAAHAPLDVHIIAAPTMIGESSDVDVDLNALCASVGNYTRWLRLSVNSSLDNLYLMALRNCFATSLPGMLHQLVITGGGFGHSGYFIEASASPAGTNSWLLDFSQQDLEAILLPVKILHLESVYFHWSSQAYYGLVELRLVKGFSDNLTIPQSQLVKILVASPGLRVLHFGLRIGGVTSCISPPANLFDLEVLDLLSMDCDQYEVLFRLLSSGSKPLQLSLRTHSEMLPLLFGNEFKGFCARSTITGFYINSNDWTYVWPLAFFRSLPMPTLQTLSLFNFSLTDHRLSPSGDDENHHGSPACSRLHAIHLKHCTVHLDELMQATEALPIQVLKIGGCRVLSETGKYIEPQEVEREIAEVLPGVGFELVSQKSYKEWDPRT